MKCPTCGAVTHVLETRLTDTHATRRTRECDNLHRFVTLEVVEPAVNPGALVRAEKTVQANRARWARDRSIRLDKRSVAEVAATHGLSVKRTQDILRGRKRSGQPRRKKINSESRK